MHGPCLDDLRAMRGPALLAARLPSSAGARLAALRATHDHLFIDIACRATCGTIILAARLPRPAGERFRTRLLPLGCTYAANTVIARASASSSVGFVSTGYHDVPACATGTTGRTSATRCCARGPCG
jgi:hypothetical protein